MYSEFDHSIKACQACFVISPSTYSSSELAFLTGSCFQVGSAKTPYVTFRHFEPVVLDLV